MKEDFKAPSEPTRSQKTQGWFGALLAAWNTFWFSPADPAPLGLVRIACGLVTLYVHLVYCFDLQHFFGKNAWLDLETANAIRFEMPTQAPPSDWQEDGASSLPEDARARARVLEYFERWEADPRAVVAKGRWRWSIWHHVTDPRWMAAIHAGVLVVLVLFTVGFCTRVMSVLTWLAALSYIHRSPVTSYGPDMIMAMTLLYLMIGPSGAALSLDRLLAHRRALRRAAPASHPSTRPARKNR